MTKVTLDPIGSFSQAAITTINTNMDRIETAIENTLSRDGTIPNQMTTDLDMNTNDILNVDNIQAETVQTNHLILDGVEVTPDTPLITASAILDLLKTVDGTGSGLDADLLDGSHASEFIKYLESSTSAMAFVVDEDDMVSNSATKVPTQQSVKAYVDVNGGDLKEVATRTALKALDTTRDTLAYLTEGGREGVFVWKTGNFSAEITLDTLEGLYVKADAIASTAGAWVRSRENGVVNVLWFGADPTFVADSSPAIKAARDMLQTDSDYRGGTLLIPKGNYKCNSTIEFTSYAVGQVHNMYVEGEGVLATTLDFSGAPASTDGVKFGPHTQFGISDLMITGSRRHGLVVDGGVGGFSSQYYLKRLRIQNCIGTALVLNNTYLGTLEDIWAVSSAAGCLLSGFHTSITARRVYCSNNTGAGFQIDGLVYSSFVNCASDANQLGYVIQNVNGVSFIACGTETNTGTGYLLRTSDTISAGKLAECQNINGLSLINCFNLRNGTAGPPGNIPTFMELSTANSRPIDISLKGCTSWRNDVADFSIVAAGASGAITLHNEANKFDGTILTSGTVTQVVLDAAASFTSVAGTTSMTSPTITATTRYKIGTFSGTGATRGTEIDSTTMSHSGTGSGTEFVHAFYNTNGLVGSISTNGTTTTYATTSDENLKIKLGEFSNESAISLINQIDINEYEWKSDGKIGVGPFAQQLYSVIPDAVTIGQTLIVDDQEISIPWQVDHSKLVPYLISAIQGLSKRISELEK